MELESYRLEFHGDFWLNPIRTGSPQACGLFQKKSTFAFDESVPSTPLYSSSHSPHKYEGFKPFTT